MGNFDTSLWILPLNVVVPFDTQTITGWLLSWLFQMNVSFTYSLVCMLMTTDFIGSCHYITSICKQFELQINSMDLDTELQLWSNVKMKLQQSILQHIKLYE